MARRFTLKLSQNVPGVGLSYSELGYPQPEYMANNICLLEDGNYGRVILLNNNILREALLNNKDFCLKYLGLKIYDINENPEKVVEKIVEKVVVKKETAKAKPKPKTDDMVLITEEMAKKYPQLKDKVGTKIYYETLDSFLSEV